MKGLCVSERKASPAYHHSTTLTIRLRNKIRHLHGCEYSHAATIPLTDQFQGRIRWQGQVEIFNLHGHPSANRCYAWADVDNDPEQFVAVLEIPPIDSPRAAVRAAMDAGAIKNEEP